MDDKEQIKKDSRRRVGHSVRRKNKDFIKEQENNPIPDTTIITEIVKELTPTQKETALNIHNKLRKTAQTIIEIGNELKIATENMNKDLKELFFAEVGMSKRSAQRYMQIATHEKIKDLNSNEIEGKTMTDLMQLMAEPAKTKTITFDAIKIANGFYSKYKNKPDELKEIITQLQELLDKSQVSK